MTNSREYSQRLGTIEPAQFQAALDRFDLGRFIGAEPALTGNSKQNVFVRSTAGNFVLRGNSNFSWQFPKEQFFADLLHQHTSVPVPWPYLHDPSSDIFGWDYAIMPCLPGLQLADRSVYTALSLEDKLQIARALSETLTQLQVLTWPHAGEYALRTNTVEPLSVPYGNWVLSRIRSQVARARELSHRTTESDEEWIEEILAEGSDALQVPFTPCFLMRHFSVYNVVATRRGDGWSITGVFDLFASYFGDGEADLSFPAIRYRRGDPSLNRIFLKSYLELRPARPGFAQRFPIYILDSCLPEWTRVQNTENFAWNPIWTLREWIDCRISVLASLFTNVRRN